MHRVNMGLSQQQTFTRGSQHVCGLSEALFYSYR